MGAGFDKDKRQAVLAELQELAQTGQIRLERNGRWKPITPLPPRAALPMAVGKASDFEAGADVLLAVPGVISTEPLPDVDDLGDDAGSALNATARLVRPRQSPMSCATIQISDWRSARRLEGPGLASQPTLSRFTD